MAIDTTKAPEPMDAPSSVSEVDLAKVRSRADVIGQIKVLVIFGLAALALLYFALDIKNPTVTLLQGERVTIDDRGKDINGQVVVWACFALCLLALVPAALNVLKGWLVVAVSVAVGVAFLVGFIVWNYADQVVANPLVMANPLPGTIKYSVPLVFGALAGCLCERAGVINIAIEGQFLFGAFMASIVASLAYQAELGLLGGAAAGVMMALLLGVFALRYRVDQVVLGVVLIALALGLTDFLYGQFPAEGDPSRDYLAAGLRLDPVPQAGYPVLSDFAQSTEQIPGIGPTLYNTIFNQTILAYLMYVSVIYVAFLLYQTRWGLRVRSVGEHPKAADTVGLKVNGLRWQAILLGGAFAGLGGAFFTVGAQGGFQSNISAGNGFIALAAVIMGRWNPLYASFAALFFGLMTTLSIQLRLIEKVPSELIIALPYLATIIAVAGLVGRVRPPAADGQPYVKA